MLNLNKIKVITRTKEKYIISLFAIDTKTKDIKKVHNKHLPIDLRSVFPTYGHAVLAIFKRFGNVCVYKKDKQYLWCFDSPYMFKIERDTNEQ